MLQKSTESLVCECSNGRNRIRTLVWPNEASKLRTSFTSLVQTKATGIIHLPIGQTQSICNNKSHSAGGL